MRQHPRTWIGEFRELGAAGSIGAREAGGWELAPFQRQHAAAIARWVRTRQELRWLAPGTPPPLTAEKIIGWTKPAGAGFVLVKAGEKAPRGYGEINPMPGGSEHLWLGHLLVRPDQRGRGLGSILLRALLDEAFERRNATRVALIVFPENVAAVRCYRRAGFTLSGEEHHRFSSAGPTHRLLRLEIARAANPCSPQPSADVELASLAQGMDRTAL